MTNIAQYKAWMAIAEAYATPRDERTNRQRDIAYEGLCNAADEMRVHYKRISFINDTRYRNRSGFWWPLDTKHDQYRALSAMLIAHMGEEEFRLLKEGK